MQAPRCGCNQVSTATSSSPASPAELAALVPDLAHVLVTQVEGASYHCQPLARELTEQRALDWLDEQLGHVGF